MMRFIVAPDWFMKLPDDHQLTSKAIIELYQYSQNSEFSSAISHLIDRGSIPRPNIVIERPGRNKIAWSVRYLKNYLKLPTELMALDIGE